MYPTIFPTRPPASPTKNAEITHPVILYRIVSIPIASALSSLSLIALRTNLNLVEYNHLINTNVITKRASVK